MLLNLNISGLAVVESLDLDLQTGMSVLTGETGAGKSILLTALGLALGDRADASFIRPGSKRAEINLEFDLSDAISAQSWLLEKELNEDQHCLIRRVINVDGRSKAYINNRPVTLQFLQSLSEKLVEIHGQHEHLTLLHSDEQRRFLDESAKNQGKLKKLNEVFQQWQTTQEELHSLIQSAKENTARKELLNYQINELEQLDLENYDYMSLSSEHGRQANIGQILQSGQRQFDLLYENEQQSVNHLLGTAFNELSALTEFSPDLTEITALLGEAQIQIEEAAQQLRRFLESQEADPQRMAWLNQQLEIIHDLSRKHQVNPEQLPELSQSLKQQLDKLAQSTETIGKLTKLVEKLHKDYLDLAKQVSDRRIEFAEKTQLQISAMIQELGMPQGEFLIQVDPLENRSPRLNGLDKIDFLISANPGLPPKPLAKVASGGELSRISLAIQVSSGH